MMSFNTPVVFIIYNRPELTEKVFNSIRKVEPKNLYIIADGPKSEDDKIRCDKARSVIDNIDWSCKVSTNYSDTNLGCKQRISSGLDWVFSKVDEAIILEDDCLPHLSFFRFCSALIDRYRNEEKIFTISGNNFQFGKKSSDNSYYFSKYTHIWGWATWKRVWHQYDAGIVKWQELRGTNWLKEISHSQDELDYWAGVFDAVFNGLIDTWDFQLQFLAFFRNRVSIIPQVNIVKNIGFDNDSTHTSKYNPNNKYLKHRKIKFPLKHPNSIIANTTADNFSFEYVYRGKKYISGFEKIKPSIKRELKKLVTTKM